jgi:hypothetical protein
MLNGDLSRRSRACVSENYKYLDDDPANGRFLHVAGVVFSVIGGGGGGSGGNRGTLKARGEESVAPNSTRGLVRLATLACT